MPSNLLQIKVKALTYNDYLCLLMNISNATRASPLCHLRITEQLHHLILVCIGAIHYRIINGLWKVTQACSDE